MDSNLNMTEPYTGFDMDFTQSPHAFTTARMHIDLELEATNGNDPSFPIICALCMGDLKVSNEKDPQYSRIHNCHSTEEMMHLPCGHYIGEDCLENYRMFIGAGNQTNCPICNASFSHVCGHRIRGITTKDTQWGDIPRALDMGGFIARFCIPCEERDLDLYQTVAIVDAEKITGISFDEIKDACEIVIPGIVNGDNLKWLELKLRPEIAGNVDKIAALWRVEETMINTRLRLQQRTTQW